MFGSASRLYSRFESFSKLAEEEDPANMCFSDDGKNCIEPVRVYSEPKPASYIFVDEYGVTHQNIFRPNRSETKIFDRFYDVSTYRLMEADFGVKASRMNLRHCKKNS